MLHDQNTPDSRGTGIIGRLAARQLHRLWLWSVIVCLAAAWQHAVAADEFAPSTADIQQRVTDICRNLQSSTVRIRSGTDVSSGVIVSTNGLVLTVAHGLKADAAITMILADEQACEAKQVFVDEAADIAILTVDAGVLRDSKRNPLPIAGDALGSPGEMVMVSGYPAREPDGESTVVRHGEITASNNSIIETTCALTTGDSGGPLVNSRGELIGLNRQIGTGIDSNGHISLSAIRRALNEVELWKELLQPVRVDSKTILSSKAFRPSADVLKMARLATINVRGMDATGRVVQSAHGTVLDEHHVATKLSELISCTSLECHFADGSRIIATLLKQDRASDVAILMLKTPYQFGPAVRLRISESDEDIRRNGRIVFSAIDSENIASGIICRRRQKEPSLPSRFGATMKEDSRRILVTELSPNGSAVLAGLEVGDQLLRIDDTPVPTLIVVGNLLTPAQPGDWISIDVRRGEQEIRVQAQLQHDPAQQFEKTEFLDGRVGDVSQRRSNFQAMQHDIKIAPAACGGPLLDGSGRIIGINIARRARESTLAIPIADVLKIAAQL